MFSIQGGPHPTPLPHQGTTKPTLPFFVPPLSFLICLVRDGQLVPPTLFGSVDTLGLWKMTSCIPTARAPQRKTREATVTQLQRVTSYCICRCGTSRGTSCL